MDQVWLLLIPEWSVSPLPACRTTPTGQSHPYGDQGTSLLLLHSLLPQPCCRCSGVQPRSPAPHLTGVCCQGCSCPCDLDRGLLLRTWKECLQRKTWTQCSGQDNGHLQVERGDGKGARSAVVLATSSLRPQWVLVCVRSFTSNLKTECMLSTYFCICDM